MRVFLQPQAGLGFFLVAHICYVVAFLATGVEWTRITFLLAAVLVLAYGVTSSLVLMAGIPEDEAPLRGPVGAYTGVICIMVALSFGWNP